MKTEKEGRSKSQISVEYDASWMKKNDPTLPTLNTLKTSLGYFG